MKVTLIEAIKGCHSITSEEHPHQETNYYQSRSTQLCCHHAAMLAHKCHHQTRLPDHRETSISKFWNEMNHPWIKGDSIEERREITIESYRKTRGLEAQIVDLPKLAFILVLPPRISSSFLHYISGLPGTLQVQLTTSLARIKSVAGTERISMFRYFSMVCKAHANLFG